MAGVNVSVESTMTPDEAWARASDLSGFDEWMTIFGGWRSPIPTTLHEGVTVDSLIKVKGFRNVITWTSPSTTSRTRSRCSAPARAGSRSTCG